MKFCSLTSGSNGNCIYIENNNTGLLVDCGASAKYIEENLNEIGVNKPEAILITHEHIDHVSGLGVLMRKYKIPVFITEKTLNQINKFGKIGKVDNELFNIISANKPIKINGIEIIPFSINHDAVDPVAFRMKAEGKSIGIATDMGSYNDYIIDNLYGLDAMLIEANHDINMLECGSYSYSLKQRIRSQYGHLSNNDSAQLISKIVQNNTKNILLGHLSSDNNYHELARLTVENYLRDIRDDIDMTQLTIEVAEKKNRSRVIEV